MTNEEAIGSARGADFPPSIARVAVKAPPFWRANPEIWFRQMESQFVLAGVMTETTKFHHVVSALQPEELAIVGDLLLNPPAENPYTAIRNRLCIQYADTEEERLRDLISGMQLGDKKPSRLLLEMKSKAGRRVSDELLKSLFLQRLPAHVQQILAISNDELEKLAEMADGILSVAGSAAIQEVKTEDNTLRQMLAEISTRLSRLETRPSTPSRDSSRRGSRRRSSSRPPADPEHCWYHQRFGRRATKCTAPCTFVQEN